MNHEQRSRKTSENSKQKCFRRNFLHTTSHRLEDENFQRFILRWRKRSINTKSPPPFVRFNGFFDCCVCERAFISGDTICQIIYGSEYIFLASSSHFESPRKCQSAEIDTIENNFAKSLRDIATIRLIIGLRACAGWKSGMWIWISRFITRVNSAWNASLIWF